MFSERSVEELDSLYRRFPSPPLGPFGSILPLRQMHPRNHDFDALVLQHGVAGWWSIALPDQLLDGRVVSRLLFRCSHTSYVAHFAVSGLSAFLKRKRNAARERERGSVAFAGFMARSRITKKSFCVEVLGRYVFFVTSVLVLLCFLSFRGLFLTIFFGVLVVACQACPAGSVPLTPGPKRCLRMPRCCCVLSALFGRWALLPKRVRVHVGEMTFSLVN